MENRHSFPMTINCNLRRIWIHRRENWEKALRVLSRHCNAMGKKVRVRWNFICYCKLPLSFLSLHGITTESAFSLRCSIYRYTQKRIYDDESGVCDEKSHMTCVGIILGIRFSSLFTTVHAVCVYIEGGRGDIVSPEATAYRNSVDTLGSPHSTPLAVVDASFSVADAFV